jgi:hypothetical protein
MKLLNSALGATRICPHCRSEILQSSTTCPACRHFLRYEGAKGVVKALQATEPLRVEATVRQPVGGKGCEYSLVVTVRNDRGEELTRQVIAVGGIKAAESRIFTVVVESYSSETASTTSLVEETAVE